MRILLVRHGKPAGISTTRISGRDIGDWARNYDASGIARSSEPPPLLRALASEAACIVVSDSRRALESAAWLAGARNVTVDADLREAVLPESFAVPLTLPPGAWIVIARLAWFRNYGDAKETVTATRARAARMSDRLIALATVHECVMAVGHGMFNRFVARELRARGWRGPRLFPRAYWGVAEFEDRNVAAWFA